MFHRTLSFNVRIGEASADDVYVMGVCFLKN